jgi:hypothetical protein
VILKLPDRKDVGRYFGNLFMHFEMSDVVLAPLEKPQNGPQRLEKP